MNYGQSQAIMVLAGAKMGFAMQSEGQAKHILSSENVHPIFAVAVEREATELHNKIREQPDLIATANKFCEALISEYKIS